MLRNFRIKRGLTLSLLLLILCGGAWSLAAQQDPPAEPLKKVPATSPQTSDKPPTTPPAATDITTSSDPTAPDEGVDIAPFDYESSEKISEDLSVSFPVDI